MRVYDTTALQNRGQARSQGRGRTTPPVVGQGPLYFRQTEMFCLTVNSSDDLPRHPPTEHRRRIEHIAERGGCSAPTVIT